MKPRATGMLIGGIVGALLGLLVAWILLDNEGMRTEVGPGKAPARKIRPGDTVSLLMAAAGVVRQIASMRQR